MVRGERACTCRPWVAYELELVVGGQLVEELNVRAKVGRTAQLLGLEVLAARVDIFVRRKDLRCNVRCDARIL